MVLCIMEGVEAYRWDNISQGHLEITLRCFRAVNLNGFDRRGVYEWWWCWRGGACFTINDNNKTSKNILPPILLLNFPTQG